jgi:flagellar hook-associated protein 2
MPTVSSLGAGSGLDLNTLLNGLMAAERQPLAAVETRLRATNTEISGVGKLRSALADFQKSMAGLAEESAFRAFSATSTDEDVATVSASGSAARGSYAVTVTRVAENHRLAAATTYANADTATLGSSGDTMTIDVGGDSFTVSIGGKTLEGVRDAINDADDNPGVTASIIHDDAGYRLLLTADETGSDSFLATTYSGTDPLGLYSLNSDRNSSGSFTSADLDAVASIAGFSVTSSSNTLDDVVDGVTFTLVGAGSSTVSISRDNDKIQESASSFASAATKLFDVLDDLKNGSLSDYGALLRGIEARVRGVLTDTVGSDTYTSLSSVGIQSKVDGSIEFDSEAFLDALQSDYSNVVDLFTNGTNGFAVQLDGLMDSYLQSGGIVDAQEDSLDSRASRLEDQQTRLEARLEMVQDRYVKQFTALDSLVASLQQTGSFITRMFG